MMGATDQDDQARSEPLYMRDAQIRRKLGISEDRWPGVLAAFERNGLPGVDPITQKRFWPAVKAWLFARHGIGGSIPGPIEGDDDGEENWPHRKAG